MKTYTGLHAIRQGHPLSWTSDDVEHARQLANTISRPWGHRGPTPEEAWQTRDPLDPDRRQAFQDAVQQNQPQAAVDLEIQDTSTLSPSNRRRLDRLTISRAVEQSGYLTMKRERRRKRKRIRRPRADSDSSVPSRAAHHKD